MNELAGAPSGGMAAIAFWIAAACAVGGAVATVLSRRAIRSAVFLLGNILSLAVLFALLDAHLLAALQVIVYAGAVVVLFPSAWVEAAALPAPNHPSLWQCIGMIVGVYGVGYAIAAQAPLRHWPIVLVGLLGKVLGPIGFLDAALRGELPWRCGWLIVTNDLVWWLPFALLLRAAWRHRERP